MSGTEQDTIRLAHLSDIHVATPSTWRVGDWLSKRLASWVNLRLLGRGRRFALADRVTAAMAADLARRGIDRVVFSGDATALGFEEEVARAAELLGVGRPGMPPGLAVPGNHDYCTRAAMAGGHFERHFAPWLAGERLDGATYPFAQRVGHAWLIAVNSSRANRLPLNATGRVGAEQLGRLAELLHRLEGGPRILVTHYPLVGIHGARDRHSRELRDREDLLAVARRGGVGLWLHGHCHCPYRHGASAELPFPVVCAGSATQKGLWSYGEYTLRGRRLRAVRRVYDAESGAFRDVEEFELELP
jgi:3',5'-cyclic AMP phosphodiesterase CpdA